MEYNEKIQIEFNKSQKRISSWLGLELSLIEKVILKQYVTECVHENEALWLKGIDSGSWGGFHPEVEASARFLIDYYNLPTEIGHWFTCSGLGFCSFTKFAYEEPQKTAQYLQDKQLAEHHEI